MSLTRQTATQIDQPQTDALPGLGLGPSLGFSMAPSLGFSMAGAAPLSGLGLSGLGMSAFATTMGNAAANELIGGAPGLPGGAGQGPAVDGAADALDPARANKEEYFEPEKPVTRDQFVSDYKAQLSARMEEILKLPAADRPGRIESILKQVEDVSGRLNGGVFTDLARLNAAPSGGPGEPLENGFVPPELISTIRPFIKMVENQQEGATLSPDATVEGSKYSGTDWNSRLGVPQYRTQSDNLASPEATCNVTAFSMALERLGYNRADVESAVERELKGKYLREQKRDPNKEDLSKVELPPEYYGDAVKKYLDANNADALKNYQKLRSRATTTAERKGYAEDFHDNAQMEDQLDFLLHLNSINRTTINGNAAKILEKIEPDATKRPEVVSRQIGSKYSYTDMKTEADETFQAGGAAIMSVFHKGKGQTGTHIMSVQDADETGLTVDDPYGAMREDYRANKDGDAFAVAGKKRSNSGLANVKHNGETGADATDWKVDAAADLSADERRGASNHRSDEQVKSMLNYITFLRRPGQNKAGK